MTLGEIISEAEELEKTVSYTLAKRKTQVLCGTVAAIRKEELSDELADFLPLLEAETLGVTLADVKAFGTSPH